jgi:predicted site-specific integrase-resolvase
MSSQVDSALVDVQTDLIPLREAREALGVCGATVRRLARDGEIGARKIPGGQTKYVRADVERLARESLRPARQTVEAS